LGTKKKGDAAKARPVIDDSLQEAPGWSRGSRPGLGGEVNGGGVDRHTTLSDTRFSVLEETAERKFRGGMRQGYDPIESPNEFRASLVSGGLIK
jgi:hypothetical protein